MEAELTGANNASVWADLTRRYVSKTVKEFGRACTLCGEVDCYEGFHEPPQG
jgi:hypothetical protein